MEWDVVKVHVHGRVQGVGYRAWCREEAAVRGLNGWVRNESDGSVTVLLAGPMSTVAEMARLLEHGPSAARVTEVESAHHTGKVAQGFRIEL